MVSLGVKSMIKISAPTSFDWIRLNNKSRGFTLLEILIAILITISTLVVVLPSIDRGENQIKKQFRQFTSLNRTLYRFSRIQNQVYRLVFLIDPKQSYYWVEVRQKTPNSLESKPPFPFIKQDLFFTLDNQILSQPKTLLEGMYFKRNEDTEDSYLYVYYDPHSFSKPESLIIKRENAQWLLEFNPFKGELKIIEEDDDASQV